MSGTKKVRIVISIIVCFLLGAAPLAIGDHFGFPIWQSFFAMLILAVVVSPIAFKVISGIKTKEDEED
jgi:uncharacterized protein (DUF983 family)